MGKTFRLLAMLPFACLGIPHAKASELPPTYEMRNDAVLPPTGWQLSDLEAIALANNPTLAQAQAHVRMARGRRIQSGLLPNPIVGYSADEIGDEGTAGKQGGFIEQEIPTAGKLRLNRLTFGHEESQERWALTAQRMTVLNSMHIAFYQTLAAQRLVAVREQLGKIAENGVQVTEQLKNVGQADAPDLLAVRIESRKAKVDLAEAQNRHRRMWAHLTALVGVPQLEMRPLVGALTTGQVPLDHDATWGMIVQESPEMQIAYTGVRRAQAALARASVEPIPNVFAGASVQRNYANDETLTGVQLGVNLPVFDRNQGNVLASQAALQHASREVDRVSLSLWSRFADSWERYETSRITASEYEREILPQSRESYDMYVQAFQRRAAAFPQVLISQRAYFEAQNDYLAAVAELKKAEVELNGLLLVDGLSQPEPHGMSAPEPPGLPVRSNR
jgi:cobalt-zinc-cadmium efflux system outer membrane protein